MNKWDERFLKLAEEVSTWSKDPSTKVGAVIADGKKVVSHGFNGFPPSIEDKQEWYDEREVKYKLVIHAEVNAILNAERSVSGCTLYTTPLPPCCECAKLVAAAGITKVVSTIDPGKTQTRTFSHYETTEWIFKLAGIEYEWITRKI